MATTSDLLKHFSLSVHHSHYSCVETKLTVTTKNIYRYITWLQSLGQFWTILWQVEEFSFSFGGNKFKYPFCDICTWVRFLMTHRAVLKHGRYFLGTSMDDLKCSLNHNCRTASDLLRFAALNVHWRKGYHTHNLYIMTLQKKGSIFLLLQFMTVSFIGNCCSVQIKELYSNFSL